MVHVMFRILVVTFAASLVTVGCSSSKDDAPSRAERPVVVTTTTMIHDLASDIAGDRLEVQGIMKPGGDPHLYQPIPSDARMIARADLVLTHGLKLEGWIDDLVRNAGGDAEVTEITQGIKPLSDPLRTGYPDPHIWHDPQLWRATAVNVRDAFIKLDPEGKEHYERRYQDVIARYDALDKWVAEQIERVPEGQRVLVTSHDAFQYYGARYGLDVVALQGVSTESEAGARDVARIVDLVEKRSVPAIFVETSVNPKLVRQVSNETGAVVGGTLYSDSLGRADSEGGTYEGMIRENTRTIVSALATRRAEVSPRVLDAKP